MYSNPYYASLFPYPARAPQGGPLPYYPGMPQDGPLPYYPGMPQDGPLSQYPWWPQDGHSPWASLAGWPPGGGGRHSAYPGLDGPELPSQGQEARNPLSPQEAENPMSAEEARNPVFEGQDQGGKPFVINIEEAAERNRNYRRVLWTGKHLQVVLMSIPVGGDIGLEMHPNVDQFIRIEQGHAQVQMGERRDRLNFVRRVSEDDAILIPAGTWHNVINVGFVPLKLYTLYAPPEHPKGTVQRTKAEAMAEHR